MKVLLCWAESNPCFCYESQLSRVVAERRRGRIFLETLLIPFQRLPKCISIMPLRLHVGKKKDFDSSSIASSSMAAEDQRGPKAHQQQVELFSKLDTKMHILLCCSRTTSIRNVHLMLLSNCLLFKWQDRRIMRMKQLKYICLKTRTNDVPLGNILTTRA